MKLNVFHGEEYLFTINCFIVHSNDFDFNLKKVVESEQGLINKFSYQFEGENIFLKDAGIVSKYSECNVQVWYQNTELLNALEYQNIESLNASQYFEIEIKRLCQDSLKVNVCKFDTIGHLKKLICDSIYPKKKYLTVNYVKEIDSLSKKPIHDSYDVLCDVSIKPDQIKLTYNGITMENDNLKLWLYGINQSCKIYMLLKLGMKNYHISREISLQRKKIQFDVPKTKKQKIY